MSHIPFFKKRYFFFLLGMLLFSIGMFSISIIRIWFAIPLAILCTLGTKWCFKKVNQDYLNHKLTTNEKKLKVQLDKLL